MPSPVIELLRDLGVALERIGARWYLFGAQAALLHGAARLTADVDVTVDLGEQPSSRLVAAMKAEGFDLRIEDVDAFVERTRVIPMVHTRSRIAVDLVLSGPGPEELFFERSERLTVDDVTIWVACAEDIITMKILAGRSKDMDDVMAILAAHPRDLNLDLVRSTLALLEQALGQSDLLPAFERTVARASLGDRR